jgi:hypothetical protein
MRSAETETLSIEYIVPGPISIDIGPGVRFSVDLRRARIAWTRIACGLVYRKKGLIQEDIE